jgi:hypothetical protein
MSSSKKDPPPHGSTQTPVEGRFKGESKETLARAGAAEKAEAPPLASSAVSGAPQPQNVSASDAEDAELVRRELRHLTRQLSESAVVAGKEETTKQSGGGGGGAQASAAREPAAAAAAKMEQKGADQAAGAADAGAAAVALVEGIVEAAARRLGIDQGEP